MIGKRKKLEKWVAHELTIGQQNLRLEVCFSHLKRIETDPFLNRIVTCDEKWVCYDNTERRGVWLNSDEPPIHMPKPALHQKKLMIIVWWSMSGLIHFNYLKTSQTMNAERYCAELMQMHENLIKKQPSLVNRKVPILLQDNARPHVCKMTLEKIKELGYETLVHPQYSPDLAQTDYHLFKHMAAFLSNKKFEKDDQLKKELDEFFNSNSQEFYATGIQKLVER